MRRVFLTLIPLMLSTAALAQSVEYHSTNGQIFVGTPNANGAVLTSKYPVSIYTEAGAASTWKEAPETIYVGKSCDVLSTWRGKGTWGWANGGFVIEFKTGVTLGFPRQGLDAGQGGACQL